MSDRAASRPLQGSELKIRRAVRHRDELDQILAAYGARLKPYWADIEGDAQHVKLAFSEPPPEEIPIVLGDAVHNLRAALDLMVCDFAATCGVDVDAPKSRLKFPFANSETEFTKIIDKDLQALGPEFQTMLKTHQAYTGGNEMLCGLHDLDIRDKHRYVMPLMACAWGKSAFEHALDSLTAQGISTAGIVVIGDDIPSLTPEGFVMPKADTSAADFNSMHIGKPATALFPDGMPFARRHILPTLDALIAMTDQMVLDVRSQFYGQDRS